MAKAWITEVEALPVQHGNLEQNTIPLDGSTHAVTYTTSTQTVALGSNTRLVRFIADNIAHVTMGDNPTADADDFYIPADTQVLLGVTPGQKLAIYDGVG